MASRLTGAYLCEMRSYFSSTKYVLYIKSESQNQEDESDTPQMSVILQGTRNQSDIRVLPLRSLLSARPIQEGDDREKFSITTNQNEMIILHSRERDRILTEISIEKERLPTEMSLSANSGLSFKMEGAENPGEQIYQLAHQSFVQQPIQGEASLSFDEFSVEHKKNIFFQDQETSSKILTVRNFGICFSPIVANEARPANQEIITLNLSQLNHQQQKSRAHSRQPTRDKTKEVATNRSQNIWIMYADIEFVYRPKKQDVDNNTGKSVMYIVKKNKEVEKFYYDETKDNIFGSLSKNYNGLLGYPIPKKESVSLNREEFADGKYFSIDDQALNQYIFQAELSKPNYLKPVGENYRMLLEMPFSNTKDKEVELKLCNNRLIIRQRVKQRANEGEQGSEKGTIIFAARIDTLQRVVKCQTNEGAGEYGLSLHLSFYWENKDSYRDICLKRPKDGQDVSYHNKNMSGLISSILILREEIQSDYGFVQEERQGGEAKLQLSTTLLNKLQVLSLTERPTPAEAVMGSLPLTRDFEQNGSNLGQVSVDIDFEQATFASLIRIWTDMDLLPAEQISELPKLEAKMMVQLRKVSENCNFYGWRPAEDSHFKEFVQKLSNQIDDYEKAESSQISMQYDPIQPEFNESELDTASEDENQARHSQAEAVRQTEGKVDYIDTIDNMESNDDLSMSMSRRIDDSRSAQILKTEGFHKVDESYGASLEKIGRMLVIFQKLMQSNHIFSSLFILSGNNHECQTLTRRLFKLMKVDNFLITHLASQSIISIMRFVDQSQKSNEERNKTLLFKNMGFIKYIGRHLSFYDRYLKMQSKVFCHMSLKMIADLLQAFVCNRAAPTMAPAANNRLLTDINYKQSLTSVPRSGGDYSIINGGGVSRSINETDMKNFIKRLVGENNEYKLLHIIERFSLMDNLVGRVCYGRIVSDLLSFCYSVAGDKIVIRNQESYIFGLMQYRLFAYSISLLCQVETLMKGIPLTQEKGVTVLKSTYVNALTTFTLLMKQNHKAVYVLQKIFKKFLFDKVSTYNEQIENWGQVEWHNFFVIVRNENLEGPKDFWNEICRSDCLQGLSKEIKSFNKNVSNHINPILRQTNDLSHLTHYYGDNGQVHTTKLHLKWNFEELKIRYKSESEQIKVWKYYLKKLLVEENDDTQEPRLHPDFDKKDAKKLWDHLIEVFIPENTVRENLEKRLLILKCLILLYREHFERIGPMKLLPYWLRLMQDQREKHCHFLVLQLILVILDLPKSEIAIKNAKMFDEAGGLQIIVGCLNHGYKELSKSEIYQKIKELESKPNGENNLSISEAGNIEFQVDKMSDVIEQSEVASETMLRDEQTANFNSVVQQTLPDHVDHSSPQLNMPGGAANDDKSLENLLVAADDSNRSINISLQDPNIDGSMRDIEGQKLNYTMTIRERNIFKDNSESINLTILAFTILDFYLSQPKNRSDDPLSRSKRFLLQRQNIAVIIQLLLLDSNDLLRCILKFIYQHFRSSFALEMIKNSGIIEFLILLLDNCNLTNFNEPENMDDQKNEQDRAQPSDGQEFPLTLADCAFDLIKRLQDVQEEDNNEDLGDLANHFDTNDQNILDQDRNKNKNDSGGDLQMSLFLRYLPLPLIIASQNKDVNYMQGVQEKKGFLQIYQSESHEQATIIWNESMRSHLKEQITRNLADLVIQVDRYFKSDEQFRTQESIIHKTDGIPMYSCSIQERVKYKQIEKEVKCGKYYLRIWVNQRDKSNKKDLATIITIPPGEETDYLTNLKQSMAGILQHMDFEQLESNPFEKENAKLIKDLTYTIKACLYAGETFKNKDFICKDEIIDLIQRIMDKFKGRFPDSIVHDFQQILMISLQIINTLIVTPDAAKRITSDQNQSYLKNNRKSIVQHSQIVSIHENIIDKIYEKARKKPNQEQDSPKESILKQFEASILKYSVQNLDAMVQQMKQDKIEIQGENRMFKLCISLTKMLGLSNDLFKALTIYNLEEPIRREQKLQSVQKQSSTTQNPSEMSLISTAQSAAPSNKTKKELNKKYIGSNLHVLGLASQHEVRRPKPPNSLSRSQKATTTRASSRKSFAFDESKTQSKDDSHQKQNILKQQKHQAEKKSNLQSKNYEITFESKDVVMAFQNRQKKAENMQQEGQLEANIADEKFKSVLSLTASIFKLALHLSVDEQFVPDLIKSGLVWRTIQFLQFSTQRDAIHYYKEIDFIIENCCLILTYCVAKATEKIEDIELLQSDNNNKANDNEHSQIWLKFNEAISKLLPKKILETLQVPQLKIGNKRLTMSDNEYKNHATKFRKLFQLDREATPELIWETSMRDELKNILQSQLNQILVHCQHTNEFLSDPDMFRHQLMDFRYTVEQNELKIEEIFVRHFNDDIFFSPPNILQFVKALVQRLHQDTAQGELTKNLTLDGVQDILEISRALHNLIQYQNALNTVDFQINDNIELFCKILYSKSQADFSDEISQKMTEIKTVVVEMLVLISQDKELAPSLLGSLHFVLLVAQAFNKDIHENAFESHLMERLTLILGEIWEFRSRLNDAEFIEEYHKFLNRDGMLLFCLKVILNRNQNKDARCQVSYLLQQNIKQDSVTERKLGAWFPVQFLNYRKKPQSPSESEEKEHERAREFIQHVDNMNFSNVVIVWNNAMRDGLQQSISIKCNELLQQLEGLTEFGRHAFENNDFSLDEQPSDELKELTKINMAHEVIVDDIILRRFNQNPGVFIQKNFGLFVQALLSKLSELSNVLNRISHDLVNESGSMILEHTDGQIETVSAEHLGRIQAYVASQMTVVLTSILLCIEQVRTNDFNPNYKERVNSVKKAIEANKQALTQGKQRQVAKAAAQLSPEETLTLEKLNILPVKSLVRQIDEELARSTFTDKDLPVELRVTYLQLVSSVMQISERRLSCSPAFIGFIKKMVINIADYSETPTLEAIIGLDLVAQTIEKNGSDRQTIVEIFEIHELQSLKKICFQQGQDQRPGLAKVSTQVMHLLAQKSPEICQQFQEDAKNQTEEEDKKWSQILNTVQDGTGSENSKTGVQWYKPNILKPTDISQQFVTDPGQSLSQFIEGKIGQEKAVDERLTLPLLARESVAQHMAQETSILEHRDTDAPLVELMIEKLQKQQK